MFTRSRILDVDSLNKQIDIFLAIDNYQPTGESVDPQFLDLIAAIENHLRTQDQFVSIFPDKYPVDDARLSMGAHLFRKLRFERGGKAIPWLSGLDRTNKIHLLRWYYDDYLRNKDQYEAVKATESKHMENAG
jgi:hypothetical protein